MMLEHCVLFEKRFNRMNEGIPQQLKEYRVRIDALDEQLIDVLARRFAVVRAVGDLKSCEGLPVVQSERAEAVKRRAADMGKEKGLDPEFVYGLYEMMIAHAHELEHDIVGGVAGSDGAEG